MIVITLRICNHSCLQQIRGCTVCTILYLGQQGVVTPISIVLTAMTTADFCPGHWVTSSLAVWSRSHMITDSFWMVTDCNLHHSSDHSSKYGVCRSDHDILGMCTVSNLPPDALHHSRFICRIDKPKEVHHQPCPIAYHQVQCQNTQYPCRENA